MVADIEELGRMDASELHARRLNANGSVNAAERWRLHIPNRRWFILIRWRRSGSENIHLDPGPPRQRRRTR